MIDTKGMTKEALEAMKKLKQDRMNLAVRHTDKKLEGKSPRTPYSFHLF